MRSPRDTLSGLEASRRDFGAKVTGFVITVATNLLDTGEEALVAAANARELETLKIIHEPAVAVLAYAAEQKREEQGVNKNILVADLGGTRCDAAVVTSMGGMQTVLATAQDYGLGGLKLHEVLVDDFLKRLIKKHKLDPGNERSVAKLGGRRGLCLWAPRRPFLSSRLLMHMICTLTLPLTDYGTSSLKIYSAGLYHSWRT